MNSQLSLATVFCLCLLLLTSAGCNSGPEAESGYDVVKIRRTLLQLEDQLNLGVDSLQCGLPEVGEGDPIFVSNGFVVRSGDELRDLCVGLVEPRTGGVWEIDTVSVNVLSSDVAYVVREGTYTISFKDRDSQSVDPVLTTIWHRKGGEWKMVHLHESSVDIF